MQKLSITKLFRFSASHQLPNHNGLCKRTHGHSYLLEVTVGGKPKTKHKKAPDHGMIMDFGKLKRTVEDRIINQLDHRHLNEIIPQPTAENIVLWIVNNIGIKVSRIRLWEEIDSAYCTWEI
jgi:6-pyruvoyltetrahydropterin/6-carboxytetrahydropterin synthase